MERLSQLLRISGMHAAARQQMLMRGLIAAADAWQFAGVARSGRCR
jgi:hypothetical protein